MNPCIKCKRTECPKVCYPKRDWKKHVEREERKIKKRYESRNRNTGRQVRDI